jgi:hypothetical protein
LNVKELNVNIETIQLTEFEKLVSFWIYRRQSEQDNSAETTACVCVCVCACARVRAVSNGPPKWLHQTNR